MKPLLERYFGRIPGGRTEPPPEVVTMEPTQLGEKRYLAEAETSPTVRIWWHAVPFVHKDAHGPRPADRRPLRPHRPALQGAGAGPTARERGDRLGRPQEVRGFVQVEVAVKEDKSPAAVEAAVYEEIDRLQKEPVPEAELQKVKNQAKANAYRRLQSPTFIMFQLLQYEGLGDWRYINTYADQVSAVTAEDLMRVARSYLTPEDRLVGVFLRK